MQVGDLAYDHDRGLLTKDGITVRLSTGKRRDIWFLLVNNQNHVMHEAFIKSAIWGHRFTSDGLIRVHIYYLRRALKRLQSDCKIANWGFGNWELMTGE
jgi:DNA-binding response OmpR family regulator